MEYTLINTMIASLVSAFVLGMAAKKLKLPAIFGYLLAGIAIGPHTPGFVADAFLAKQLAEIGVILLMFGVGLHFSLNDLLYSRKIALPGAIFQMITATLIGTMVALALDYPIVSSIVFGFSLSVASTVVLIRSLEQRNMLRSQGGKLAISWLIIEDIAMVVALVLLPVFAEIVNGTEEASFKIILQTSLLAICKIVGFLVFIIIVGRKYLPWLLISISRMRSAELSTLGTLAIALSFASIAYFLFDASLALGAFLAGVMIGESEIGEKTADSTLSMRDAFSVLFFVSVGILFDPTILWAHPIAVVVTFLTIVVAKSVAALAITSWFKLPKDISYSVAIALAQIGEFSFIIGGLALTKGLISQELYNLILAGAMLSIVVNPLIFRLYDMKFSNKNTD